MTFVLIGLFWALSLAGGSWLWIGFAERAFKEGYERGESDTMQRIKLRDGNHGAVPEIHDAEIIEYL